MDVKPFARWLPGRGSEENLRAEYFYLAQVETDCYKCFSRIIVNAIVLPEGFESLDDYAIEELDKKGILVEENIFCKQDYLSILSYITYISPEALDEINKYNDNKLFGKKYSTAIGYSYYRSICPHCHAAQGDNFVITEHDSVFSPIDPQNFEKINFHKIQLKIKVRVGGNSIGYGPSNNVTIRNIWKN